MKKSKLLLVGFALVFVLPFMSACGDAEARNDRRGWSLTTLMTHEEWGALVDFSIGEVAFLHPEYPEVNMRWYFIDMMGQSLPLMREPTEREAEERGLTALGDVPRFRFRFTNHASYIRSQTGDAMLVVWDDVPFLYVDIGASSHMDGPGLLSLHFLEINPQAAVHDYQHVGSRMFSIFRLQNVYLPNFNAG